MQQVSKEEKRKKYFIVFICLLIQSITYCIAQNLQGQMQIPVSQSGVVSEVGFTLLYFSGTLPVFLNPYFATFYEKFNIKYIYVVGIIIGGLAFASYGLAKNSIMFNVSSFFNQVGTIFYSGLSLPIMMSHWFPGEGRGSALGIALAGGSIGNVFLQPVVVNLLARYGWQQTYIILGIAMIAIGIPIALLFIRFPKPGEVTKVEALDKKDIGQMSYEGLSDKENMKNKYFWTFNIGALLLCFASVAVSTQAIPVLSIKGFEGSRVALAGSTYGLACLIGNIGGGKLFDKLGSFKPMILSAISTTLALLIMAFMPMGSSLGFLIPILSGLTIYTLTSGPAFMPADVFGYKDGTQKMAKVGVFYAAGSAFAAYIFAALSSSVGLQTTCLIFLVIGLVGYILNGFSIIKSKKMFSLRAE